MTDPASPPPAPDAPRGLLVQAPVPPLDPNGLVVTTVGTIVFAVASVVLVLLRARLIAAGDGWWIAVPMAGVGLGLIGIAYCWRRRGRAH